MKSDLTECFAVINARTHRLAQTGLGSIAKLFTSILMKEAEARSSHDVATGMEISIQHSILAEAYLLARKCPPLYRTYNPLTHR